MKEVEKYQWVEDVIDESILDGSIKNRAEAFIVKLILRFVKDPKNFDVVLDEVKKLVNFEAIAKTKAGTTNKRELGNAIRDAINKHESLQYLPSQLKAAIVDRIFKGKVAE